MTRIVTICHAIVSDNLKASYSYLKYPCNVHRSTFSFLYYTGSLWFFSSVVPEKITLVEEREDQTPLQGLLPR